MKPKRLAKKFVFGQVVLEKANYPINGEIHVLENILGEKTISVGGLTQSGRIIEQIWGDGVKSLSKKPGKVLILGFGAGSTARVINKRFPKAEIIGVEIDPVIVRLAKKYFNLEALENLKLSIGDASSWVKRSREKFDLILVDIYQGRKIPESCQTGEFFKGVKLLLSKDGKVIFNHLYSHEEKKAAEEFRKKLEKVFPKIKVVRSAANILFKV